MRKNLLWKLILAFMLVAVVTAALVALFIRLTSEDRLTQLIIDQQASSINQSLVNYFTANGSWDGIEKSWSEIERAAMPASTPFPGPTYPTSTPLPTPDAGAQAVEPTPPSDQPWRSPGSFWPPSSQNYSRRRLFGLADSSGKVIVSVDLSYPAGAIIPSDQMKSGAPVKVNNKTVGYVLTARQLPGLNPEETLFLQRTNQALLLGIGCASLVALLMGILLARAITKPINALTRAAQNIARGQLEQEVKVTSRDEVGQLATAFNRMSAEVSRGNQLRRQMTADIAHDLRTPLTVIAGYVESMRDGVLKPTSDRLSLIYSEIERLQDLVGDLRMLSQADSGELSIHPQMISPDGLLSRAAATFQHRAGQQKVKITVDADKDLPDIKVDEARMMQVLGNLLSNSLRYTPEGGKIVLSGKMNSKSVILSVEDNGCGISPEDLPYIFDRFHRADKSRHSDGGESGLGLAIVKALVEAQGGKVDAESSVGKGTAVHIHMPV